MKKLDMLVAGCFLFFLTSLTAEVIGNLEFEPPVSLAEWNTTESLKDEESPLKMYSQSYEHNIGNFSEGLFAMLFFSKELPIYSEGYTRKTDIKSYLTNKWQKMAEQTCESEESYSDPHVLVTDIIADPTSLFYKVTMFDGQRIFACFWAREIKKKGQWIQFFYGLYPNDPDFLIQDMEKIASSWIQFLRDDFSEKVVYVR